MPAAEKKTYFRTIQHFKADFCPSEFTQYESERTGMQVVVVDEKGPKVHGYFALATEIHDDSGAPHTLEHLVFMGSKNYKYKGVLDKLATRAYSNTNAWTATDHTAYTLDTAGWDGFAQILPVYLEHVLLPTLTDAGCYTEVHHVDGTGHDAGVVYSEMQGVQNRQGELMDLRAKRLLYPEDVGFRYETGGMMEQLRVLTADRIRAFHREMYQPKNLCLVLIGEIDHENLLEILDNFEGEILSDIPSPKAPFKRPWVESAQTPPLKTTVIERVEFPEEDESSGEINVTFLGPHAKDAVQRAALAVLLVYLADSSISVLENTLVEKEQVASAVYYNLDPRPDTNIWFGLSSVATDKLERVEKRFIDLLKETASKPLDMSYLLDCLHRHKRQEMYQYEDYALSFATPIITDFLFGERDGTTLKDLSTLKALDTVERWTDEQWRDFMKRWISDAPHVSILGVPSAKLSAKIKADEEARVEAQKASLGEAGLKRLEQKLAEAKAENDREIPRSILEQFKIPHTESIHFTKTTTGRSGAARKMGTLENDIQKLIDKDQPDLPLFMHFEHFPSNFIKFTLLLSTEAVPVQLRPLLSIYIDNFFSTPVLRNRQRIEFEQVVTEIEQDTIHHGIDEGSAIGIPEVLRIRFVVEPDKYERAIEWLRETLFDSIFDEARLQATITKLLADVPEEKREGSSMVSAVRTITQFAPESVERATSTLVKALYLKRTKRLLEKDPSAVIAQLEEIRRSLCRFENFRVLVLGGIEKLQKPVTSWAPFLKRLETDRSITPLDRPSNRLSEAGKKPGNVAYLVPMPTIDSSYSNHTTRGPGSYTDPQRPALMVALAYLDAVEGPMWCAVRGTGLAYGTRFSRRTGTSMLDFNIYRSPDAYKAFVASRKVIEGFVDGTTAFEGPALEGAVSSIVVNFADEQPNVSSAAMTNIINQLVREVPATYNEDTLKKVRAVTVEEMKAVLKEVVLPVFLPETSNLFCTCAPIMEKGIKEGFESEGFKIQVEPLSFFQDDYGLKLDGDDDDEDDEDDEDKDEEDEEEDDDDEDDDNAEETVDIDAGKKIKA